MDRLALEKGAVRKDWGGRISVALVYPNAYRVGMSNLGFQVVYSLLNRREDVVAERVFLPEGKEMSLCVDAGKGLLSLESLSPLHRFDLIAFSLSFENDYPNILRILSLGKIPCLSEERKEHHPFVMAGGITTFLNPEPLAPFFDFFLLGEAEATLENFLAAFREIRAHSGGRQEALQDLAGAVKSLYVPSLYRVHYNKDGTIQSREPERGAPERIEVLRPKLTDMPVRTSTLLTPESEFPDRVLIELGRGCTRSCRFCAAGYVYRPPRIHDASSLLKTVGDVLKKEPSVGLLSACVSDVPGIEEITGLVLREGGRFSVSSLRADSLTRPLIEHLRDAGQKTLAVAPEAGSERLRKVINKHLTGEQIVDAVRIIGAAGDFSLRLYFLIGLPTETPEDVSEVLELVKTIKHHLVKEAATRGRIRQIKLSINCFIPKPFTPFQWFPMDTVQSLKEKQKWLKKALGREGGIKVSFDLPKWAYVQALLSLGDRRVASMLLLSHVHGEDWQKAFTHSEINPDFFVYRPKNLDENLPWDFIDHGIYKEHLLKEYKLSLKGEESDICHVGDCIRCGVC
ncbi:MAG: radical SAM protein [Desulfobacterota bacterium]|nr:radical SAM protein [Thermodesulfobacteriota bacterium]